MIEFVQLPPRIDVPGSPSTQADSDPTNFPDWPVFAVRFLQHIQFGQELFSPNRSATILRTVPIRLAAIRKNRMPLQLFLPLSNRTLLVPVCVQMTTDWPAECWSRSEAFRSCR